MIIIIINKSPARPRGADPEGVLDIYLWSIYLIKEISLIGIAFVLHTKDYRFEPYIS